jgi:hypothetical protein
MAKVFGYRCPGLLQNILTPQRNRALENNPVEIRLTKQLEGTAAPTAESTKVESEDNAAEEKFSVAKYKTKLNALNEEQAQSEMNECNKAVEKMNTSIDTTKSLTAALEKHLQYLQVSSRIAEKKVALLDTNKKALEVFKDLEDARFKFQRLSQEIEEEKSDWRDK